MNKGLRILFFIVTCLFVIPEMQAQRKRIDSLQKVLPQQKDTIRIRTLLTLAHAYRRVNLDSAIEYAAIALKESETKKYKYGLYYGTYKLGDYYREKGEFEKSLTFLNQCLKIGIDIKDSAGTAQTYNSIGSTYIKTGDFTKALGAFQNSLKIKERRSDKNGMANTLINIGSIYQNMSILDKAEEYILKGVELKKQTGDKHGVAGSLNNLSIIYTRTKRIKKSIEVLESILKDYTSQMEPYLESAVLGNLAEAYQGDSQFAKALVYAKKCVDIREEMGDSSELSYALLTVANLESDNKNYAEAIKYAKRTLRMGKNMGMLAHVWDANITLGTAYFEMKDYKNASLYYQDVIKLSDTLINSRAFTVIHEMDAKYESDKKEAEISKLNNQKKISELELDRQEADISRQRWIMLFGAMLIVCLLIGSVVVYRSYKAKKKSNEKLQSAYNTIEEKQKEILDSIYYARRIQSSLFTSQKFIEKTLQRLKKKM